MTEKEKIEAMRVSAPELVGDSTDREFFSWIVFMGYMDYLMETGVITTGPYMTSEKGKDLIAICHEFDWRISNNEIVSFVNYLFDDTEENKLKMVELIISLRDDPIEFR